MHINKPEQKQSEGREGPDLVWGVEAIGGVINRTPRQTNHMLASGMIPPAQKVGNKWVASRNALLSFFGVAK